MAANAPKRPTQDPVLRALELAPLDDEPFTEEDRLAVLKARQQIKRGQVVSTEEILRRLAL